MGCLLIGREALDRHDWATARAAYQEAVRRAPSGESFEGLAVALFWLNDADAAFQAMGRAYERYRREGPPGRAALAALWLAGQYLRIRGNASAARGWASRCERLLAGAGHCPEVGRALLIRAVAGGDWAEIEAAAERAIEIAREFGDSDGELLGLAYGGLALVSTGRVSQGLERLDEAMAGATGEARSPETVGQVFCAVLSGCERTADLSRAEQWSQVAQPFLATYARTGMTGSCRAIHAGLLAAAGRWDDAERELLLALAAFDQGAPAMRGDALVRLAELRVKQGRLDEARALLEGQETHPDAQAPLAALELARGRPKVAVALLERRVRRLDRGDLQQAPLLLELVRAQIAAGDVAAAAATAARFRAIAHPGVPAAGGMAHMAEGLARRARGGDAAPELERALALFERAGMVYEAAGTRLALAECATGDNPELAAREARIALTALAGMGARPAADRAAALLRSLGQAVPPRPASAATLSRREREVARLVSLGLSNDRIAAQLFLSRRTVEHHVSSILRKLDASTRAEIAVYAVRELKAESV
ncbi:MAG TPA: LuxR C-terminal-related transcriptional regulator [Candidatus Dormibacteraeota bacterium]|nr:LuxR C-terminal-related transcriptional regulator [Candidatus Dormibacteraeota bacterium]